MFLRAFVRSAWGLEARAMPYAELARWLTAGEFPTSKGDLENARRPNARLVEHLMPTGRGVDRFVGFIQSRFRSFEAHRLYAP